MLSLRSASILGFYLFCHLAQAAVSDRATIINNTAQRLDFQMHCIDPVKPWTQFSADPNAKLNIGSDNCGKYGFEMTTKNGGVSTKVNYTLMPNTDYKLIFDTKNNAFNVVTVVPKKDPVNTIANTNNVVATNNVNTVNAVNSVNTVNNTERATIVNKTNQTLNFQMHCIDPVKPWKQFSAEPNTRHFIGSDNCGKYGFEMTTKNGGVSTKVNYTLMPSTEYKLIFDTKNNAFNVVK